MSHDYLSSVEELIENKYLVSFESEPQNDLDLWGYILASNQELTLVNQFDRDLYALDGYALIFTEDISEYWVYTPDENYLETKYINAVGIKPKDQSQIDIKNIESAMESISSHFELLNIYRDDLEEDIGTVIGNLAGLGEESFG